MAQIVALFSLLNVILLIGLIWIYMSSFRKVRAQFTLGLVFFGVVLGPESDRALLLRHYVHVLRSWSNWNSVGDNGGSNGST